MALNDNSYSAGTDPSNYNEEIENNKTPDDEEDGLNNKSFSGDKDKDGQQSFKKKANQKPVAKMLDTVIKGDASNDPLSQQEEKQARAVDAGIVAASTYLKVPAQPGEYYKGVQDTPRIHRNLMSLIKKILTTSLVSAMLPPLLLVIGFTAIVDLLFSYVVQGVEDAHQADNVAQSAKISAENFYGVRILYKNNELANKNLTTTYNQLVFEFLQTVSSSEIEGIESLNINLPSNIYEGDLTSYQTPLTIVMVYKTVESVLNSQGLLEPVVVNGENFEQSLSQINNFGFNETSFVSATSSIATLFKEKVQASLEDADESNNLVTFKEGTDVLPANFETVLNGLWAGENFNKFKISTEKLFVKDVILSEDENSLNTAVDGNVVKYIYMAKEGAVLSDKDYGMKVEPGEEYNIAFKTIVNGEESVIKQDIANETWCSLEEDGNYYYSKQLYLENINITCPEFTSLDSANLNFLNKDNFSLYNAGFTSLDSTGKCFTVAQTEGETGYYTINSNLTCDCAFVEITPISQTSTNYTFSEIY